MKRRPRTTGGGAAAPAAALILLVLLDASTARADSAPRGQTVILLQPAAASVAVRRSLARIRDEASADRFQVSVADSGGGGDPGAVIDRGATDRGVSAVLALFGDPETGEAELCLVQRAGHRTAVRRATVVSSDPDRMPEALAARALELLRATALELSIEVEREPPARPRPEPGAGPSIQAQLTPAAAAERPSAVAALGVGLWSSVDGPPAAVVPFVRAGVRLSDQAWVRLSLAGLGSRPRVESAHGTGAISQGLVLAEVAAVFRGGKRIQPTVSLGAGALNVAVMGTGVAPYEGREPRRWSAAFDGGIGVGFALSPRAAVVTELHALVAAPHPVVRFGDTRLATIGYPSLILTVALQVAP